MLNYGLPFLTLPILFLFFIKTPVQIKEFGAVSKVDFSPQPPYNYAVTASSRVSAEVIVFALVIGFTAERGPSF